MDVYWLKQSEGDIQVGIDWLSAAEVRFMDGLRFAPRRTSWRLGRWTVKRAVASYLNLPDSDSALTRIEIRPAASGAPEVFLDDRLAAISISLSHRDGRSLCGVAPGAIELGCDLELIESHSSAFVGDYFTAEERSLIERQPVADRPRLVALLWSAKESALKALHTGLRLDTRSVVVSPLDLTFGQSGWKPFIALHAGEKVFHGWWQVGDKMVRTIAAAPPPAQPILLKVTARIPESLPHNRGSRFVVWSKRN